MSKKSSLLWSIEGKKLKKTSYLYGTIHIRNKRVFLFDDIVKECFDRSEAFAMEVLLDDMQQSDYVKLFLMTKHKLIDLIGSEYYKKLDKHLKQNSFPGVAMFNNTKPIFVSSHLLQSYDSNDMKENLDSYFFEQAKIQSKQVFGLENFKEQIKAINKISLKSQAEMLIHLIDNIKTSEKKYNKLVEAYIKLDFKGILKMLKDPSLPENFETAMLGDRNSIMCKRIEKICRKYSCFIVFGAGHLAGKYSIVKMLQDKGYEVKPIYFKFKEE